MKKIPELEMLKNTANIEKEKIKWCKKKKHFKKKVNENGFCNYCQNCFLMYNKLNERINTLEKTSQNNIIKNDSDLFPYC